MQMGLAIYLSWLSKGWDYMPRYMLVLQGTVALPTSVLHPSEEAGPRRTEGQRIVGPAHSRYHI